MGGQQRQQAQPGTGQGRRPGDTGTALLGELSPQRPGLADQGSEAGPAPEQLIGLPHERLGTCQVSERDVDAGELGPGLHGEVGSA